ncbi:hypothetical protein GRI97_11235 [Altererythrobacter xixiisoli]|uniref:Lipoprotein n=1 Tax=Croceibacterium xixiisoli TaxID=1476466 RepID=A0A6I4TWR2_9SPHN|nr:hypothetical protein [Croceibacterium xixiisoli]MXO99561.1 hypothetical protein [Croceibacterium xixiisoli]
MNRHLLALALTGALFPLSGCSAAESAAVAPVNEEEAQAVREAANAAQAARAPSRAEAPPLTEYVGKYPFDEVAGIAWNDHPLVKAGIARTVTDPAVRDAMATVKGPSAPIALQDGKVAAWSCQQHRCGEHSWSVMVDPASGATDVCYMKDPAMENQSRWFLADGTQETRQTDCSLKS